MRFSCALCQNSHHHRPKIHFFDRAGVLAEHVFYTLGLHKWTPSGEILCSGRSPTQSKFRSLLKQYFAHLGENVGVGAKDIHLAAK